MRICAEFHNLSRKNRPRSPALVPLDKPWDM